MRPKHNNAAVAAILAVLSVAAPSLAAPSPVAVQSVATQQRPTETAEPTASETQAAPTPAPAIPTPTCEQQPTPTQGDASKADGYIPTDTTDPNFWIMCATFAMLVVASFQLSASWAATEAASEATEAAKQATGIAERTNVLTFRPWLSVAGGLNEDMARLVRARVEDDDAFDNSRVPIAAYITIKNSGPSPAIGVLLTTEWHIGDAGSPIPTEMGSGAVTRPLPPIAPEASVDYGLSGPDLTMQEMVGIFDDDPYRRVVILGSLQYRNAIGVEGLHQTDFCLVQSATGTTILGLGGTRHGFT